MVTTANVEDPLDADYSSSSLPSLWPDAPAGLDATEWSERWQARRAELVSSLAATVYGATPLGGGLRSSTLISEEQSFQGAAVRREYELIVEGPRGNHAIDLLLHLPSDAPGPMPVFLGLNFNGNQATTAEPGLRPSSARRSAAVVERESGAEAVRVVETGVDGVAPIGADREMWPAREVVERGYGLATAHHAQIEEDRPLDRSPGIGSLFGDGASWGVIGMWAWGMSRMLDALELIPEVDHNAVISLGHSRLGKTALWAAAQDERFVAAISNDSGCAGASLFRHRGGESLASITTVFPHWFTSALSEFAGREAELPVDQHQLLAAIAPRPVHVASASDDAWADPRGEFLAAVHASRLFETFGARNLFHQDTPAGIDIPPSKAVLVPSPAPGLTIGDRLSYHLRSGPHRMCAEDWAHFLDFADRVAVENKDSASSNSGCPPTRSPSSILP